MASIGVGHVCTPFTPQKASHPRCRFSRRSQVIGAPPEHPGGLLGCLGSQGGGRDGPSARRLSPKSARISGDTYTRARGTVVNASRLRGDPVARLAITPGWTGATINRTKILNDPARASIRGDSCSPCLADYSHQGSNRVAHLTAACALAASRVAITPTDGSVGKLRDQL